MSSRGFRTDRAKATELIQDLFPVPAVREAVGRLVADVVAAAQEVAPHSWILRADRREIFLNVGQVAVLILAPEVAVLYTTQFPARPVGLSDYESRRGQSVYAAVKCPSARLAMDPGRLVTLPRGVRRNLLAFVRAAAAAKTRSPWSYAHSPAVVAALGSAARRKIDQPPDRGPIAHRDESVVTAERLGRDFARMQEVEQAAVARVSATYRSRGWRVRSREAEKIGYDLDVTRAGESRHVEVKGRARGADSVILTSGEWRRARKDPKWTLAVVSFAGERHEALTEFTGARVRALADVEPVAFRVGLPR